MLEKLLDKARELGYSVVRLDTAKYLETAIHIYRSNGFIEIEKYPETMSEGPGYIYMEKKL
ncbi:hypothetical protein JW865_06400 [Candidatus Bathyarchaeota archaeon]|nr:hypothetical protein [Candidatus Bathyarchaeota archaeon]